MVSLVRTAYGPGRQVWRTDRLRRCFLLGWCSCLLQSHMCGLPGKVSWNWCWPDCLLLLLLPSELIMEDASLIPGSMEEKYWLAGGWTGMWIPDWRLELMMDVRSVTERETMGFSQLTQIIKDSAQFNGMWARVRGFGGTVLGFPSWKLNSSCTAAVCSWSWPLTSLRRERIPPQDSLKMETRLLSSSYQLNQSPCYRQG